MYVLNDPPNDGYPSANHILVIKIGKHIHCSHQKFFVDMCQGHSFTTQEETLELKSSEITFQPNVCQHYNIICS